MKFFAFSLLFFCSQILYAQCNSKLPYARNASWSPDGSKIVYVSNISGNNEIYIMNADGTKSKKITNTEHPNYYPFFSPNGKQIVFMSYRSPNTVIYVMDIDGSNLQQLTPDNAINGDPFFTPDGAKIVFFSERDENQDIYIMNADGSKEQRLTDHTASENSPIVSPDGKKIVFVSTRDGNAEIYTMDLDGKNQKRITDDPRSDRVPRWSPDSKKIIWYSREPSNVAGSGTLSWNGAELYEIDLETQNRKQLTHNYALEQAPSYSPNGKIILFTSCRTGSRQIFTMDLDGNNVKQLTFSINEKEAVKDLVESTYASLFYNNGTPELFKKGFHPNFHMYSHFKNESSLWSYDQFVEYFKTNQKKIEPKSWEFKEIDVTGNMAMVKLEVFSKEKKVYTDYITLFKLAEGWRIFSKTYTVH